MPRSTDSTPSPGVFGCLAALAVAAAVTLILTYALCFVTVHKGEVGVTVWMGGQVEDRTLDPGWHLVSPARTVHRVSVQTHKVEEPATVPTRGGLSVQLKAVLLYHVRPADAPKLVRELPVDKFEDVVVEPVFKNAVRDACAEFEPEALYTQARQAVEAKVLARLDKELGDRGFVAEAVMIQDPVLPQVVQDRIQAKVGAEQDVVRMGFVLKQKELEAQAKVAEAKGIADAQKIIKKDLDAPYLQYQFIEALKVMASHNNLIYFVPVGPDGLPLVRQVEGKK